MGSTKGTVSIPFHYVFTAGDEESNSAPADKKIKTKNEDHKEEVSSTVKSPSPNVAKAEKTEADSSEADARVDKQAKKDEKEPKPGPSGSNTGDSSSDDDEEMSEEERARKRVQIQRQLRMLLHVNRCLAEDAEYERDGQTPPPCRVYHCRTIRDVLEHMKTCDDGKCLLSCMASKKGKQFFPNSRDGVQVSLLLQLAVPHQALGQLWFPTVPGVLAVEEAKARRNWPLKHC